jgi:hypothetical protein
VFGGTEQTARSGGRSGLWWELPGVTVVATGAPQLSDNSTWLTGEALVFSGAGWVLPCCHVTMQSGRSTVSPTVVETTTEKPAPVRAELASLYFCPTTLGAEAACATPLSKTITAQTAVVMVAVTRTALFVLTLPSAQICLKCQSLVPSDNAAARLREGAKPHM